MQSNEDRIRTEIEARVAWGEDPDSIRQWLVEQDAVIEQPELEDVFRDVLGRKAGSLMSGGMIRVIAGGALLTLAFLFGVNYGKALGATLSQSAFGMVLLSVVLGGMGFWLLLRGIGQFFNGVSMKSVAAGLRTVHPEQESVNVEPEQQEQEQEVPALPQEADSAETA